ncbi:MAG: InlB B-repeat-containing protein [Syntrophorhabdaceae bacterium]
MYHQRKWSIVKSACFSLAFFALVFFLSAHNAAAANVSLAWDAAAGVAGYKVYYGTSSRNYTASVNVGNTTTRTVSSLTDGTKYYFSVTAYNSSGVESPYSNEVSYGGSTSCAYTLSPTSASFGTAGGTGSISVAAAAGCSWTASTGVSWATISSGSTGSGSGTVTYRVSANTGATRSASFSVAGKAFTISQSGASSSGTGYTLTVTKNGTGSGTVTTNPPGSTYASGTAVTLTAAPGTNSVFAGWSGGCSGTALTCRGTMTRNVAVTATFNAKTTSAYTITASAGSGGSISPTGAWTVASGSSRSFVITPNSGYVISSVVVDGVSKGALSSYTFTNVTANHTIQASFRLSSTSTTNYTLTITKTGTGSGTVAASPAGPTYPSGAAVTLTATPGTNSVFAGWSGGCSGTALTCRGTMTRNVSVTAIFNSRY